MEQIYEKNGLRYIWLSPATDTRTDYWKILKTLYGEYAGELQKYSTQTVDNVPFESNGADESFQYVLVQKEGDGDNIGFLGYAISPGSFSKHDVYLNSFFIREPYKRQGYGTEIAENFLKAAEFYEKDITMDILSGNLCAAAFWEKLFYDHGYSERLSDGEIDARKMGNREQIFCYYSKLQSKHTE